MILFHVVPRHRLRVRSCGRRFLPPGDGWCDQDNNKAECNYDGGDVRVAWSMLVLDSVLRWQHASDASFLLLVAAMLVLLFATAVAR